MNIIKFTHMKKMLVWYFQIVYAKGGFHVFTGKL